MSNALAIAAVSGVLGSRIQTLLTNASLSGFDVTAGHPNGQSNPGVYLHLYQILPNPDMRNRTLPERRAGGSAICPMRLAIDLHFLISFVGELTSFDSERLAGLVMNGLNEVPVFSSTEIDDYVAALTPGHVLAGSDLSSQMEPVRIAPLSLELEDLSRLWGMFGQSTHRLSVAYRASVVLIDAEVEYGTALPVARRDLTTFPMRAPRIRSLASSARDLPLVRFGEDVVVRGEALRGERTLLRIGDTALELPDARDEEIRISFDAASGLAAGMVPARVIHEVTLDDGSTREAAASNTVPLALVPAVAMENPDATLVHDAEGNFTLREVRLTVEPLPSADQHVELLLVGTAGEGRAASANWRLDAGVVVVTTGSLAPGTYLVRLQVDGAVSLLEVDATTGLYAEPAVNVT